MAIIIIFIDKTNMEHNIKKWVKPIYYRVVDTQTGSYFSVGYNSQSKRELIKRFKEYISIVDNIPKSSVNTWVKIEDWLQGTKIEKSNKPFEN